MSLDQETLLDAYRLMRTIREFEERVNVEFTAGNIPGFVHLYAGEEAVAVGACIHLGPNDYIGSTHRGHGHCIAKRCDVKGMMHELFGKKTGLCGGKGGSMHIADFQVGILGAHGAVGANIPLAAGAAHAIKLKGEEHMVVCIFGDGAINRGPFLEGLNWASVFELPVLFVCEDNGFAATTRTATLSGGPGPLARAESLGVPGIEVDGNDILAVDTAAQESIARVRAGGGPRFVLARTYRLAGHTAADPGAYRSSEELESHWRDDPLEHCATLLRDAGAATERLAQIRNSAAIDMAAALEAARAAPWPEPALAFADVQDVGAPRMRAGR